MKVITLIFAALYLLFLPGYVNCCLITPYGANKIRMNTTSDDGSTCDTSTITLTQDSSPHFVGIILSEETAASSVTMASVQNNNADVFMNLDNIMFSYDGCASDPLKTLAGVCGCGVPDTDSDADGVADCIDNCSDTYNPDQGNVDGDEYGDACEPSAQPSTTPSLTPTMSNAPSNGPSFRPSISTKPSSNPTFQPSISSNPSLSPSEMPSRSIAPSNTPTSSPSSSALPSSMPSEFPSYSIRPSTFPSLLPSTTPSTRPSSAPSSNPSTLPSSSSSPSSSPSHTPSSQPSHSPSLTPTSSPTKEDCANPEYLCISGGKRRKLLSDIVANERPKSRGGRLRGVQGSSEYAYRTPRFLKGSKDDTPSYSICRYKISDDKYETKCVDAEELYQLRHDNDDYTYTCGCCDESIAYKNSYNETIYQQITIQYFSTIL